MPIFMGTTAKYRGSLMFLFIIAFVGREALVAKPTITQSRIHRDLPQDGSDSFSGTETLQVLAQVPVKVDTVLISEREKGQPVTVVVSESNADISARNATKGPSQSIRTIDNEWRKRSGDYDWGTTKDEYAIFYNVYMEPGSQGRRRQTSLQSLREHLEQIANSTFGQSTLYYNMIGSNDTAFVRSYSHQMDVRLIRHMETGQEVDTLQDLYNFCQDRPNVTVVYLHNKGSFHPSKANDKVRRLTTRSATSEPCRSISSDPRCTSCAMNVMLQPSVHSSGNMWTAKCSYVRNLIPPKEFTARRESMFQHIMNNPPEKAQFPCLETLYVLGESEHSRLGLGRYAMETWMYQHPSALPCFAMNTPLGKLEHGWESLEFRLNVAPWLRWRLDWIGHWRLEWYQKPGRSYELKYLYGLDRLPASPFWDQWDHIVPNPITNCTIIEEWSKPRAPFVRTRFRLRNKTLSVEELESSIRSGAASEILPGE